MAAARGSLARGVCVEALTGAFLRPTDVGCSDVKFAAAAWRFFVGDFFVDTAIAGGPPSVFNCNLGTYAVVRPPTSMNFIASPFTLAPSVFPQRT